MNIIDIINKKKAGGILNKEEIEFFVRGYVDGSIPDYQASALLMAVCLKELNEKETIDLTLSMINSGDIIDLSDIPGMKIDKHSTGGVADTTTLVAAPIVAACGGTVLKMSGRGLGHTGGTLDKIESIPGCRVELPFKSVKDQVTKTGIAVIGQTGNLVPADKKLYALRDVTGTIDSISLIAASVMSKKIAAGSDAIVLDVKTGSGAFMKKLEDAVALANTMVKIGNLLGKKTTALVTDMNQPLGNAVGNALEVQEAIEILSGQHEGALKQLGIKLAQRMLVCGEKFKSEVEALIAINDAINSGKALEKLQQMIAAQGGNPRVTEDVTLLPQAAELVSVNAEKSGYISSIINSEIGVSAMLLGAGRQKKEDVIDPAVGLWMKKRIGDYVKKGEELAVFHVNKKDMVETSVNRFLSAVHISDEQAAIPDLIYQIII